MNGPNLKGLCVSSLIMWIPLAIYNYVMTNSYVMTLEFVDEHPSLFIIT